MKLLIHEKLKNLNVLDKNEIDEILEKAEQAFYNSEDPILSDSEYDKLKDYRNTKFKEDKRVKVGAKVKVENTLTVKHRYENLLGTLDKVKSVNELEKWISNKNININDLGFSLKADGFSISICYKRGKIDIASTRGDDNFGKDLTEYFKNCKLYLDQNVLDLNNIEELKGKDFGIAYEAVITYDNFNELLKETTYSNPRNCIAGILSTDGIIYSKYLSLIPLKLEVENVELSREEMVNILNKININEDISFNYLIKPFNTIDEIEFLYNSIVNNRLDIPFCIDGIVVETLNENHRFNLGINTNERSPNYAIALKLPAITRTTKVINMDFFTEGNNGIHTPMVYFEPLEIDGKNYSKVSIANYARFKKLRLTEGSVVEFSLANDILGYINLLERNEQGYEYQAPEVCKCCGSKLETDNSFIYCVNTNCELLLRGSLVNFFTKLKIKGISNNIVESLIDSKIITTLHDIPDLVDGKLTNKIAALDGFGVKSANKIVDSIRERLEVEDLFDYQFIGSLNIKLFGRTRCKAVFEIYNIEELLSTETI